MKFEPLRASMHRQISEAEGYAGTMQGMSRKITTYDWLCERSERGLIWLAVRKKRLRLFVLASVDQNEWFSPSYPINALFSPKIAKSDSADDVHC